MKYLILFLLLAPTLYATIPKYTDAPYQKHIFHTSLGDGVALEAGFVQGASRQVRFGYNLDIDSGPEAIVSFGGNIAIPTEAQPIRLVSTSTNDVAVTGTGARIVQVTCLDSSYDEVTINVPMNGTGNADTTEECIAVNSGRVVLSGSGKTNDGTITITQRDSGITLRQIPVGDSVTQSCMLTVPRNKQVFLDALRLDVIKLAGGGNPEVTFRSRVFNPTTNTEYVNFRIFIDSANSNTVFAEKISAQAIPEKSTLWMTAETDTSDTQVSCRAKFFILDTD